MSPRVRVVIRVGRGTPLSRAAWFSVIAHGLFGIAALTLPGLFTERRVLLPTLDVTMIGPLTEAPVRAQAPAPPQPEPVTQPAEPEGPSATPQDPPKPVPRKEPKPPAKTEPVSQEPPPKAPDVTDPSGSPAAGSPAAGAPVAGPIAVPQGGALAGMGTEFDWYRDAVIRALYAAWNRPFAAEVSEAQEVGVAFEIRSDGTVGAVQIVESSGNPSLDRSALRAVHEATLPPLPRNYGRTAQPAHFVFRLDPENL